MIYGFKSNNDILTIVVAGDTISEIESFFVIMAKGDVENTREIEIMTPLEMMMDDEFSHLPKPIVKVYHDSAVDQDAFIERFEIKVITDAQAISKQESMIRTSEKIKEREDTEKAKLKAEMLGETYVSLSIEEIYGLNIVDPWDTRTEEEKKQSKSYVNRDSSIMEETSFGDANAQREARDAARREADPDYVPVRFMGHEIEQDEDGSDFDNILLQAKSKETMKLIGVKNDQDDEDLDDKSEDKDIKESTSVVKKITTNIDSPEYSRTELTSALLSEMEDEYKDMLVYSEKKKTSFRTKTSVKVKISSLSSNIEEKIKEISESCGESSPEYVDEYWYSPASIIDGYYVFPEDSSSFNGGSSIICGHNIDPMKTLTVAINGPQTKLIKKMYTDASAMVLYASIKDVEVDGKKKKIPSFFVIRMK